MKQNHSVKDPDIGVFSDGSPLDRSRRKAARQSAARDLKKVEGTRHRLHQPEYPIPSYGSEDGEKLKPSTLYPNQGPSFFNIDREYDPCTRIQDLDRDATRVVVRVVLPATIRNFQRFASLTIVCIDGVLALEIP